jgi:hypothetical protein
MKGKISTGLRHGEQKVLREKAGESFIFFKKPLTGGKKCDKKGRLSRVKKIINIKIPNHYRLPDYLFILQEG